MNAVEQARRGSRRDTPRGHRSRSKYAPAGLPVPPRDATTGLRPGGWKRRVDAREQSMPVKRGADTTAFEAGRAYGHGLRVSWWPEDSERRVSASPTTGFESAPRKGSVDRSPRSRCSTVETSC